MAKDVIITPASGKLDFYGTSGGSVLANINLTDNNDLSLSTTSGNLIIGDASRDVYIGDGTNEVDIVFEQNGEIRSVANKYITVSAGQVNATGISVNTSSPNAVVHVYGSTPSGTVLNVEGTNGSLFSVVDNLDGTLMSVNNNAGLPVLEVFSDDSVVAGRFGQNDLVVSSSGNLGLGTGTPQAKLHVIGDTIISGDLSVVGTATNLDFQTATVTLLNLSATSGNFTNNLTVGDVPVSLSGHTHDDRYYTETETDTNFARRIYVTRTVPTTVNNYVNIGDFNISNGALNLDISISVSAGGFSVAKRYLIASNYNETTGNWNIVAPISDGGIYSNNNFILEAQHLNASISLRIVRTVGTSSGTAKITMLVLGASDAADTVFTASSSTGTTTPATTFFPSALLSMVDGKIGINKSSPSSILHVDGDIAIDNLKLDGNTISTTNTNGNLILTPNGNGGIAGGSSATVTGGYAVVAGGRSNTASGYYATIGGGNSNTASGYYATVGGGFSNTASAYYSIVGGGTFNCASGTCSTIGGGRSNTASGNTATVSGGRNNTASGTCSTIGGGCGNTASGTSSIVSGGTGNIANTFNSTVSGGTFNIACCDYSTASGGIFNASGGYASIVSGGSSNSACSTHSSISGGSQNFVNARYGSINGGHRNVIKSPTNECCSRGATIGGGIGHNTTGGTVNATCGDITGAVTCCNAGVFSTIGGGFRNIATGNYSKVGGGCCNTASGCYSTVGGGRCNNTNQPFSTIGGGGYNTASGYYVVVAGGYANCASARGSSIGGGYGNTASGYYATIGGGGGYNGNQASGAGSTISGGRGNAACGGYSSISGGSFNTASGSYSTIGGGQYAKASRYGEVAHATGKFSQNGDAQHTILVARRTTSDATSNLPLFLDGSSQRLTIPTQTMWTFEVKLSAYHDTDNEGAWWIIRGGIISNDGGDVALVGSLITESGKDSSLSTATAIVVADDTNDALEIRVTGVAAKNIRWVAVVDISQVSYGTP